LMLLHTAVTSLQHVNTPFVARNGFSRNAGAAYSTRSLFVTVNTTLRGPSRADGRVPPTPIHAV
jgi:hypothetical protein